MTFVLKADSFFLVWNNNKKPSAKQHSLQMLPQRYDIKVDRKTELQLLHALYNAIYVWHSILLYVILSQMWVKHQQT